MEERINELKDRNLEMTQGEEEREVRVKKKKSERTLWELTLLERAT